MKRIRPYLIAACTFLALPGGASASADTLIQGALQCTQHLSRYEREYGIPTHLLSAIASTESGRYHNGLKIKVPWPWTINANGKGYVFDSKAKAIAQVNKLRAQGIQSIDVGCMQVNLYHHPQAFASLDDAFDPVHNIAYAASFLRNLYEEGHSWKKAAADYHSRTPTLGREYVGLVYNSWFQIVDKLRQARLNLPDSATTAEMKDMQQTAKVAAIPVTYTPRVSTTRENGVKVTRLPEQAGHKVAAYKSPRMNSISVSRADSSRENGIIIVRADTSQSASKPIAVSSNTNDFVQDAKVIRVASPAQAEPRKSGPRFIFND